MKNGQKQSQNRQKRAREGKKVKSRSRGSLMIKESSKCLRKSSKIHIFTRKVPGQSLQSLAESVLQVSHFDKNGPLKKYLKKSQYASSKNQRLTIKALGK